MTIEQGFKGEQLPEKFKIVSAEAEYTKNCIVISENEISNIDEIDIIKVAVKNEAFEDNSNEEAGDDLYSVQFSGSEQELLDRDQISARLRSLKYPDKGE